MAINSIVKWDNTPQSVSNFLINTRMFDMGSTSYKKKVFGINITSTSASTDASSLVKVGYRTNTEVGFTPIGSIISHGGRQKVSIIRFLEPVVCYHIQFNMKDLPNIGAPVSLSDLTIMYRPLRNYSSTSGDKES